MAQTNQCNVQEVVQSLADSIQEKLVKPSETKFTSLLEETRQDLDSRTNTTREQFYQRLDELNTRLEELKKIQNRMGILCLALSVAVVASIIMQLI